MNNGGKRLDDKLLPEQVKVLELPPYVGVSRARNTGAMLATSPYIAFLDDDDLWELDYLKKAAMLIEQFHPDCIITRMDKMVNGRVCPFKNSAGRMDLATLLVENPGRGGQTTIVRRESFLLVYGYDTDLKTGEDKALIIELNIKGLFGHVCPRNSGYCA